MQILQDSSRASLPSGRRFTRRPPYNTSMTLICQIEAEGYSLSEQLNILPILSQKRFENFVLIDDIISFPVSYPPVP